MDKLLKDFIIYFFTVIGKIMLFILAGVGIAIFLSFFIALPAFLQAIILVFLFVILIFVSFSVQKEMK